MTKQEVINKLEQEIARAAATNSFHSLDKVDTNLLSAACIIYRSMRTGYLAPIITQTKVINTL